MDFNMVHWNLASNLGQLRLCYMDSRMVTAIGCYTSLRTGWSANLAYY